MKQSVWLALEEMGTQGDCANCGWEHGYMVGYPSHEGVVCKILCKKCHAEEALKQMVDP